MKKVYKVVKFINALSLDSLVLLFLVYDQNLLRQHFVVLFFPHIRYLIVA